MITNFKFVAELYKVVFAKRLTFSWFVLFAIFDLNLPVGTSDMVKLYKTKD